MKGDIDGWEWIKKQRRDPEHGRMYHREYNRVPTVKGQLLVWLLKERNGDLEQLYSENETIQSLSYGVKDIVEKYGTEQYKEYINNAVATQLATGIKDLYDNKQLETYR
tara:strand:- start:331 stop:657 length:327 start_codon:yes stop_codon:yes gene_type:complete